MEILRVENLTKVYGEDSFKVTALDNVSFSVVAYCSASFISAFNSSHVIVSLTLIIDLYKSSSIILLSYTAGYTSKEIGKMLNLKDSTVRSKLMRSTDKLRQMLHTDEVIKWKAKKIL